MALVLSFGPSPELPADIGISIKDGAYKGTYYPGKDGKIIIPLGEFQSLRETIPLQLSAKMFPMENVSYSVSAALYLSGSDAEEAPLSGEVLVSDVALNFESNKEFTGIYVWEATDKRLYTVGEAIAVFVKTSPEDLQSKYTMEVQLHREADGTYGNTALPYQRDGSAYAFDLSSMSKGNYCVVVTLTNSRQYVIAESRYYFIVKPSDTEGTA